MEPEAVHIGQGVDPVTHRAQPITGRFLTRLGHSDMADVVFPIFITLQC